MNTCVQEKENCPHADESADRAVRKVFAMLGVDVDDPTSISAFQQDLRFGGRMRRISDRINLTIILTIVVASVSGTAALIWSKVTG